MLFRVLLRQVTHCVRKGPMLWTVIKEASPGGFFLRLLFFLFLKILFLDSSLSEFVHTLERDVVSPRLHSIFLMCVDVFCFC